MVCLLIAFLIALSPHISIKDWDLLAFIGSILGGLITWLGVKKTLSEQRKDKFLERYREQMKELDTIVKKSRYIINVPAMVLSKKEEDDSVDVIGTLHMHADFLNDFIDEINAKVPDLILTLDDWEFVHALDTKIKILSGFNAYYRHIDRYIMSDGVPRMRDIIDKYLLKAEEIHLDLDHHQEVLMGKYYEMQDREFFKSRK